MTDMTNVFTSAGLWRIAVVCGATDEEIATGDPAEAFVRRWVQAPPDEWFEDVLSTNELFGLHQAPDEHWASVWLGFEDVGPLSFVRFAGFLEVGVRCGYLDLNCFSARRELQAAIERWTFSKEDPGRCESLAVALLNRLLGGQERLEPCNAAGIAAFESYIRLDETVRGDPELREFLEVCHREGPPVRDLFLTAPEFFAEALLTRRFGRLSVGGQVSGGLQAAKAMEGLAQLLASLGQNGYLRQSFTLHARWAHQADKVFRRLQMWALSAQQWNAIAGIEKDPGLGWRDYQEGTVTPLVEQQRSILLLADPTWSPTPLSDVGFVIEDSLTLESAGLAEANGHIDTALSIYAKMAQNLAQELDQNDGNQVDLYWSLIKELLRLGDQPTAAALSSVAYGTLRHRIMFFTPIESQDRELATLDNLRLFLLRPRMAIEMRAPELSEPDAVQQATSIEPGSTQTQTEPTTTTSSPAAHRTLGA
jgi:hypothetical protein